MSAPAAPPAAAKLKGPAAAEPFIIIDVPVEPGAAVAAIPHAVSL